MALAQLRRHRRPLMATAVALASLGLAATAAAVDVRGKLEIPQELVEHEYSEPEGAAKPYWEEWNGFVDRAEPAPEPARKLAVVLRGSSSDEPTGCEYALRGGDLYPETIVAKSGTTIRIENTDGCAHELYAEGLDDFSALQTAPGNARTVTVDKAGNWPLRDARYRHVRGHLHVVPDLAACGRIAEDGRFEFKGVSPGSYTLSVYKGARQLASKKVEISEGGTQKLEPIALSAASE